MSAGNRQRLDTHAPDTRMEIVMKKWKIVGYIISMAVLTGVSGCELRKPSLIKEAVVPQHTPTPAPTPMPVTATPVPTSTPAPRLIGVKTSTAKFIYLTNHTRVNWREVYVKQSGGDEWGKNLIPSESSVKAAEQVQMYYIAQSYEAGTTFDLKIITAGGEKYEIYLVDLGDMEKASLTSENGVASLRYTSLSEKTEKTTGADQQSTTAADTDNYNNYNYNSGYDYNYNSSYNYNSGYDYNYNSSYNYNSGYDYNYNSGYNYNSEYNYNNNSGYNYD